MADTPVFLLLEDSADDAILVQRSFSRGNVLNPIISLPSAEDGMSYLLGVGPYNDRKRFPLPSLILLDLKLPGMDGFEFLKWLRVQPTLKTLRVIVLTSSERVRDIDMAYKLGANSYLIKPLDFERFVEISLALNGCWLWMDKRPEEFILQPGARPLSPTNPWITAPAPAPPAVTKPKATRRPRGASGIRPASS